MGFPDLVPLVTPPHHGTYVGFLFCFLTLSFHGGWIDLGDDLDDFFCRGWVGWVDLDFPVWVLWVLLLWCEWVFFFESGFVVVRI